MRSQFSTQSRPSLNKLVAALSIVGTLTACGKFDSTGKLIDEARIYYKKGEDKSALIQAKNALQKDPDNVEVRLLLARLYKDGGAVQSAEDEVRKALKLGAKADEAVPLLATCLIAKGKPQKALEELAALGDAAGAEAQTVRGIGLFELDRRDEAQAAFEAARKASADYPGAMIGLARLALMNRDTTTATQLIEQAAKAHPDDVSLLLFQAGLQRAQGNVQGALGLYGKVISVKPGDVNARLARAEVEIGLNKLEDAKADIEAARKTALNTLPVLQTQAHLDYVEKKYSAARDEIQQVLRAAPEHMPSLLLAGATELALGSSQQAEQYLKKYTEKDSGNLFANKLLINALLRNGQTDRAVVAIDAALKNNSQDPQLLALAGEAYMKAKRFSKATEFFEQASAFEPKAAEIRTALGLSRLAQGDAQHAIADLETATGLDSSSVNAAIPLIMTHVRMKNFDKALAVADKLEKDQQRNPLALQLKGTVQLEKGDIKAARAEFEKAVAIDPTYFPAVDRLAQLDIQDNKPELAQKRFEAVVEKDKKNLASMIALADLANSQGNRQLATTWLERAAKEIPDDPKPSMLLASHYLRIGEKDKALTLARNLQTLYPTKPEVLETLASMQAAAGDVPGALDTMKKVTALLPDSPVPQVKMAALYAASGNDAAAEEALKKAITLQPSFLDAQLAMAALNLKAKRFDAALRVARDIQKQYDKSPVGFSLEGDIYRAQNQPAQAVKAYEQALGMGKSGVNLIKLVETLKATGKDKDAETRVATWLKDNPNDTTVRVYEGTAYLLNHKLPEAIKDFEMALQSQPKNPMVLNNLALAYQEKNDPKAMKLAEQAATLAPDNSQTTDTFGWLLVQNNNAKKGLPLLQKSVELDPNSADNRYHLAVAYMKVKDKQKAKEQLEQLISRHPGSSLVADAKKILGTM